MEKKTKKKVEQKPTFDAKGMKVQNVRRLSEKVVVFSLNGNGLGLYNLRVVGGAKGEFIGTPQTKGKDGNYYNQYAVYFDEKTERALIKKVLASVEDEDEEDEDEEDEEIPF